MITSLQNPLIKRIRRLQQKKYRLAEGVFFLEGLKSVAAAVEHKAEIEQFIWGVTATILRNFFHFLRAD